jgi:hypothetical protein
MKNHIIQALQLLASLLPAIIAVENAIGSQAPGSAKKSLILSAMTAAAHAGEQTDSQTIALGSTLTDVIVTGLNASGVFGRSATATPPPATQ